MACLASRDFEFVEKTQTLSEIILKLLLFMCNFIELALYQSARRLELSIEKIESIDNVNAIKLEV